MDDASGIKFVRPQQVAGISKAAKNRIISKVRELVITYKYLLDSNLDWQYNAYSLADIPTSIQKYLLREWESMKVSFEPANAEYHDILMVLASCYRAGFGGEKNKDKAFELELEAAQCGSEVGKIHSLMFSILDGFNLPIAHDQKLSWLMDAICFVFFPGPSTPEHMQDRFRTALEEAVPYALKEINLIHSFTQCNMRDWEILHGDFDGAAEDPLFSLAIQGDEANLISALDSDTSLVLCKKDGYTLLHVAADYGQEHIIRG